MSLTSGEVCADCGEPFVGTAYGTRGCVITPSGLVITTERPKHEHHCRKAWNGLVPEEGVRPPV